MIRAADDTIQRTANVTIAVEDKYKVLIVVNVRRSKGTIACVLYHDVTGADE